MTRPNITFALSVVSEFLNSTCDVQWDVVVRILIYIKGHPSKGLLHKNRVHTQIVSYSNADWQVL